MARLEITNSDGAIDLSMITADAVSALTEEQAAVLAIFVDSVHTREAATIRKNAAQARVRTAMIAETEAEAAHFAANPPMTAIEAQRAAIDAFNKSHA
jgi:hypothetical protein